MLRLYDAAWSCNGVLPPGQYMVEAQHAASLPHHMSNENPKTATKIRIIEDEEATGDTAAAYDSWRAGSGRQQVPGIIKCFGARPDFLRQVVEFSNTLHFSEGHLSRRYKEMLATYVSSLNRCPY